MKLNLTLLSRVLTQPWAIREQTLVALTRALLSGEGNVQRPTLNVQRPNADTTWAEFTFDEEKGWGRHKLPTTKGYTILNWEGMMASLRGTLPPVADGVHVFLVWGALGRGWTEIDRWWMDPVDTDDLCTAMAAVPEGEKTVLWFRSPGGIVTGIPEAGAEIRRLGETRKIVAFTDDLCASAAYWLAAQCSRIVATPTAAVGSIGVYLAFYDFCGYLEKMGVKLELFRSGDLKGIGVMGNPLDEAAREYLMDGVKDARKMFVKAVTDMRALEEATMQGQTLEGAAAKKANLVDGFKPSASAFLAGL
jgi:signal peptide peptidase SppA